MFIVLTILVYYSSTVAGEQRDRKKNKSKNKSTFTIKKHKKLNDEDDKKQIQCLVRSAEFVMSDFDENHRCYNPGLNATATKRFLISTCPMETKFCITEVLRIHGVFAGINRKCGGEFCVEACFSRAFGIERETCTFCCEGVQPQHFQELQDGGDELIEARSNGESNSITHNRSLTSKEIKDLKLRLQEEQMKTAYQCPPYFLKTEF